MRLGGLEFVIAGAFLLKPLTARDAILFEGRIWGGCVLQGEEGKGGEFGGGRRANEVDVSRYDSCQDFTGVESSLASYP